LKEREIKPILRQSPLIVRSAALRSFDFTLLKPCSIGLKSGEYWLGFSKKLAKTHASKMPVALLGANDRIVALLID